MSTFAFLFAWFAASPQGKAFAEEKFAENSDNRHILRMSNDVASLGHEAAAAISTLASSEDHEATKNTPKSVSLLSAKGKQNMAALLSSYLAQSCARWEH